ncbi:MAG: hypothetical protein ACK55Z_23595, partial [bacterium]
LTHDLFILTEKLLLQFRILPTVMILAKQIALISERLPMRNHDSGTIEEIATRPLIRSHLCHQIRFNNSTRRSNAPTGTAEIK